MGVYVLTWCVLGLRALALLHPACLDAGLILGCVIAGFTLIFSRSCANSDSLPDSPASKIRESNA